MKKTTGKILATFMAFGILISSTPGEVLAAEETGATKGDGIEAFDEWTDTSITREGFNVGGTVLAKDGAIREAIPAGMSIDFETSTITLKNCTINGDVFVNPFSATDTSGKVTIQLEGNNSINGRVEFNMEETVIQGDGTLNINLPGLMDYPGYVYYKGTMIQTEGKLTMYSGVLNIIAAGNIDFFEGIASPGDVSLLGGQVNIQCGDAPNRGLPPQQKTEWQRGLRIYGGDLEVSDAELCISLGESNGSRGIEISGFPELNEDGTFSDVVKGGKIKIKNASIKMYGAGVRDKVTMSCDRLPESEGNLYCYIGDYQAARKVSMAEVLPDPVYEGGFYEATSHYIEFSSVEHPAIPDFRDVSLKDWYYNAMFYASSRNLMTGLNPTAFAPYNTLPRAQFAVILHRMSGEPAMEYTPKFADVQPGLWYTNAVLWANSVGVVNGYTDTGLFGTADSINREQMVTMMYRYAKQENRNTDEKADISSYTDASLVSGYAKEAMSWAVGSGIITGKENGTRLDPQGTASRAECATIIMRFCQKYQIK